MKSILTLLLSCTVMLVQAQNFIDINFGQYKDLEQTKVVHVAAKSFEYASYVIPSNDEEERELKEFIASVKSLDLIAVEDLETAKSEFNRGVRLLERGYDELINIKDKSSQFSFFIDANDEVVYELVGIGTDEGEFFVVSVTGEMKLDIIASILSKIDSDQLMPLAKINEYDAIEFEIYPNPVNSATTLTIEIPESLIGGKGAIYDLKGTAFENFSITDQIHKVQTQNLNPGTYVVLLEKEDISLKKQVVIVR